MTKKPELIIIASQYYIECQMSVAEISRRLNVSEELLAELYIAAKELLIDKELKKKVYGE